MQLTSLTNFFLPNVLLDDSWKWFFDDKDYHFTMKRLRELIDNKILDSSNAAQKTRWNKTIPRKVCIFIGRCQQKRLPVGHGSIILVWISILLFAHIAVMILKH